MKTKKFLLQLEFPEETRWLHTDDQVMAELATMARLVIASATHGPRPAVAVSLEEQPAAAGIPTAD